MLIYWQAEAWRRLPGDLVTRHRPLIDFREAELARLYLLGGGYSRLVAKVFVERTHRSRRIENWLLILTSINLDKYELVKSTYKHLQVVLLGELLHGGIFTEVLDEIG